MKKEQEQGRRGGALWVGRPGLLLLPLGVEQADAHVFVNLAGRNKLAREGADDHFLRPLGSRARSRSLVLCLGIVGPGKEEKGQKERGGG